VAIVEEQGAESMEHRGEKIEALAK